nr:unnamed protein product [Callosobruchus chinensis]
MGNGKWDKTMDGFKDRNATRDAWREVCCALKEGFVETQSKEKNEFGSLNNHLCRELKAFCTVNKTTTRTTQAIKHAAAQMKLN